jgi:hypothetical protein
MSRGLKVRLPRRFRFRAVSRESEVNGALSLNERCEISLSQGRSSGVQQPLLVDTSVPNPSLLVPLHTTFPKSFCCKPDNPAHHTNKQSVP